MQWGRRCVAALIALAILTSCSSNPDPPRVTHTAPVTSAVTTAPSGVTTAPPAVRGSTPGGQWWGVDSTARIGPDTLANVAGWYRGHPRPQVWGRYLTGSYAVSSQELAFARAHGINVYLLVHDRNCSVCANGGDLCGNDGTPAQAQLDAEEALTAARRLAVPRAATLFKDIEQTGACNGELTASYLLAWFRTVKRAGFQVGFYGNTNEQANDFPVQYCHAVVDPQFRAEVILADDEPEPALGAPSGTIGPANAPPFRPDVPHCAPRAATKIWQYGESTSSDNATDVDEIATDTPGLLTPAGGIT